ncbi:hypothetical protein BH11ARM2_BH11ARM2_27210 [soil metagenome]
MAMREKLNPDALLQAIDARDPARFLAFLTPDANFRYGANPVMEGSPTIKAFLEAFYPSLASIHHRKIGCWEVDGGETVFLEGVVTYGYPYGKEAMLPFLNHLSLEDGLIREYDIYIDPTPALAAMA